MQVRQIRFLRRLLISLILMVSLAVLVNYLQALRLRRTFVQPAAKVLSPDLLRSADNIRYTAHESGSVKFEVIAKRVLETRQGKELLQGIEASDFNPDGSERNRISSEYGEYDGQGKQIYFSGNVRLRFEKNVELRTESLYYNYGNQTGYSNDNLQLQSPQASGTARGVRYDNARRRLELLSELAFIVHRNAAKPDGSAQIEHYELSSQQGYYAEAEGVLRLTGSVRIKSAAGTLIGDRIEAAFGPDKRHITSLICQGHAVYQSTDQSEVRTLEGERIAFGIAEKTQALESIHVLEQARFELRSKSGDQKLSAADIYLELDPLRGQPHLIRSQSGVRFEMARGTQSTTITGEWLEALFLPDSSGLENLYARGQAALKTGGEASSTDELQAEEMRIAMRSLEGRSTPRELKAERAVQWISPGRSAGPGGTPAPGRSLTASFLTMLYSENGESLSSGMASGGVIISAQPAPGVSSTELRRLQCDRVDFTFYPDSNRLEDLTGEGGVEVFYQQPSAGSARDPEEYRTSSSRIRAHFRMADGSAETIHQGGGFSYQDAARTARSGTCDFTAASDTLVLRDGPVITDAGSITSGDVIEYDRRQHLLSVRSHVRSILTSGPGKTQGPLTGSSEPSAPSIVTADEMMYWTEQAKVRYNGRVHLLSADSQLQTQTLEIYNSGEQIEARDGVSHLILRFSGGDAGTAKVSGQTASAGGRGESSRVTGPVLIRSNQMQYSRIANRIHYVGNAYLDSAGTKVWSDSMDVFLDADGRRVERASAQGNLRITQPGREARGDGAEYFLSAGKFVVTGNPAELFDHLKKGKSSAARLTFYAADDRILLGR